jgi:hypothetical protein
LRQKEAYERLRLRAGLAAVNPVLRQSLQQVEANLERMASERERNEPARANPLYAPADHRRQATDLPEEAEIENTLLGVVAWSILVLLVWPALWILWAFLARGGFSFPIAGLALVRRDGRLAERWRCAWRAFLVWGPVAILLASSVLLESWYWSTWEPADPYFWLRWLAHVAWWAGFGLLVVYVVLALRSPSRALHDRLAGTVVVPN